MLLLLLYIKIHSLNYNTISILSLTIIIQIPIDCFKGLIIPMDAIGNIYKSRFLFYVYTIIGIDIFSILDIVHIHFSKWNSLGNILYLSLFFRILYEIWTMVGGLFVSWTIGTHKCNERDSEYLDSNDKKVVKIAGKYIVEWTKEFIILSTIIHLDDKCH